MYDLNLRNYTLVTDATFKITISSSARYSITVFFLSS